MVGSFKLPGVVPDQFSLLAVAGFVQALVVY